MMLDRDHVDAVRIAEHEFVQAFLEEGRRDVRVAIFVRQARAHRIGAVEHFLRHEGIGDLTLKPGVHERISPAYCWMKAMTRSASAAGCSISG